MEAVATPSTPVEALKNGMKVLIDPESLKKWKEEREASGMLGWEVELKDEHGATKKAFLRGPQNEAEVLDAISITFRNWTPVSYQRSTRSRPAENARPVPPSAYQYGVLETLHSKRKR